MVEETFVDKAILDVIDRVTSEQKNLMYYMTGKTLEEGKRYQQGGLIMPANNCKTLKDAMFYFEEDSLYRKPNARHARPYHQYFSDQRSEKYEVKKIIFAPPATIVYWKDGSRTVVKCNENDEFSEEMGFLLCFMKKWFGNTGKFNDYIADALSTAKRYYPEVSSEVPDYIRLIKDNLIKILSNKEKKCDE